MNLIPSIHSFQETNISDALYLTFNNLSFHSGSFKILLQSFNWIQTNSEFRFQIEIGPITKKPSSAFEKGNQQGHGKVFPRYVTSARSFFTLGSHRFFSVFLSFGRASITSHHPSKFNELFEASVSEPIGALSGGIFHRSLQILSELQLPSWRSSNLRAA